ncbi:MAG: 2-succinyl-5-enolpyruvyl-6-hydroxy-3-cyclohexene-1-carboxylic-acid synthase [Demequinaceae bacterium]|nr:2-succinyl-5-enolpyruvyl-6-hydroxy-3-cyclohexene-1-carboxylic-acid synthase [Demequinaceae bacterium]
MNPSPNGTFARALVAHLAANGVTRFVLCPGSRSGPLAYALADAAQAEPPINAPDIHLHVRIDERSAGFLALGLAMATGEPVAIVTTSGTAVGNLLPAVMEAHHGGHRLILLTADRPFDARGTGPNQTTDQRRLFGSFVQFSRDVLPPTRGRALAAEAEAIVAEALAHAAGAVPASNPASDTVGPVHLNLQFRPPLGHDHGPWPTAQEAAFTIPEEAPVPPLPSIEKAIVVAGHGAGPAATAIASSRGWPLFAEPTSDSRRGPCCITGYAEVLQGDRARALLDEVGFVLVIGRPTLSREVARLILEAPRLWVARHGARWQEAPADAEVVCGEIPFEWVRGTPVEPEADSWLGRWLELSREPIVEDWGPRAVAQEVVASAHSQTLLVVGSSGPIRAVDVVLPPLRMSERPRILANRGLSGIDGTVSTAVGVALAGVGPVTALIGDLTFLHDVGGLLIGPHERRPNIRIVVVNDGGGTIFAGLEHGVAPADVLERMFTAPHGVGLSALCKAYGASHAAVRSREDLASALSSPPQGIEVIEADLLPDCPDSDSAEAFEPSQDGTIET